MIEKVEEAKQIPLSDAEALFLVKGMESNWSADNYKERLNYLIYKLVLIRVGKVELLNYKESETSK